MTRFTTLDGTPVSRFAFGAMQFGGRADDSQSRAMYDAARAAGITHFDTAWAYTGGASERLLGEFLQPERDRIYLATKVRFDGPLTRKVILESLDDSRTRLGQDQIDLLYLHRWDGETPLEVTFETLAELQETGRIRHIGVSNFAAWQVMKAQAVAHRLGTRIDVIQPMLNLVKRQVEVEIVPMAADQDIALATYSPLGGGLLTGKYATGGGAGRLTEDTMYNARYGADWMHDAARGLARIAAAQGTDPATLAVAWVAAHPAGVWPILSARSAEQLAPSLAGMDYPMTDALWEELTALGRSPAPATDRLEEA